MASTISTRRRRQMLAVLLAAFAALSAASLVTFHAPPGGASPWQAANACGPAGSALAWGLAWMLGRAAAFGVPVLAAVWAWNRLRDRPAGPLAASSAMGALMAFEVCGLLALGGLDRWTWTGGWGFAAALALQSALGVVGSWVVAAALLLVTALAASEMGFHWIAHLVRGAVVAPARGVVGGVAGAYGAWQ
ncbi:MAG TPA: DNA translocase FtsK 4TM domain-containing protein, partial [Candidatus Eisenbacteria bacterium]|nr:DNA translocase FtsK 4TM domain-containing protein [Candidatus Eisenbacteria bacterium]